MNVAGRLAAFAGAIVVVMAAGALVGGTLGSSAGDAAHPAAVVPKGQGVVSSVDGYRLVPAASDISPAGGLFRFTIVGPDGHAVRRFTPNHERDLHLIVVSRELTSYSHLHPTLGGDGTWSVELPAMAAGSYRAVADFVVTDGPALALGVDLSVSGVYRPTAIEEPLSRAAVDGLEVRLATDAGSSGQVTVAVSVYRDSKVVSDLEPYLGAFGHLVVMRSGDLAYVHVHPLDYRDGVVRFEAMLPSQGRYRLYFDFKTEDVVRTAAFTVDQGPIPGGATSDHGGGDHG